MCSDYARSALMYVDYSGDVYAGMGIKAMKSFGRPRGRNLKDEICYYLHCFSSGIERDARHLVIL